jgi:hypothetical protein
MQEPLYFRDVGRESCHVTFMLSNPLIDLSPTDFSIRKGTTPTAEGNELPFDGAVSEKVTF